MKDSQSPPPSNAALHNPEGAAPATSARRAIRLDLGLPRRPDDVPRSPPAAKEPPRTSDCRDEIPLDDNEVLVPFPLEILPGPFGAMADMLAEALQTARDLTCMLALIAISAALRGRVCVTVRRGYSEPLNIFAVVALPPSERKSAAHHDMLQPLAEFEAAEVARLKPEIARARRMRQIAEKRLALAMNAAARMPDSADVDQSIVHASEALERATVPPAPRLIVNDATPEALRTLLYENGGAMAILSAEGGDVFKAMAGRYGADGGLSVYLSGYSAEALRVDRASREPEYVEKPALTVGLATQPETFEIFGRRPELRHRGLPARFLYSLPASILGQRRSDAPSVPDVTRAEYRTALLAVIATPRLRDGNRDVQWSMTLDPDAYRVFLALSERIEARLAEGHDLHALSDWAGKLVGNAVRIAGLIEIAQRITDGDAEPWKGTVRAASMTIAARLAEEYFVPHAKRAFGLMGETAAVRAARRLRAWLVRSGKKVFTASDAQRAIGGKGARELVVDPGLRVLESHGTIRRMQTASGVKTGRGGEPAEMFSVNPSVGQKR